MSRLDTDLDFIVTPGSVDRVKLLWKPARHTWKTQKMLEECQRDIADEKAELQSKIAALDAKTKGSKVTDEREVTLSHHDQDSHASHSPKHRHSKMHPLRDDDLGIEQAACHSV